MTKIEKGVPIPQRVRTRIGQLLREMKVGDSFEVREDEIKRPNLYTLALRARIVITVKTVRDKESGAVSFRVWRTE